MCMPGLPANLEPIITGGQSNVYRAPDGDSFIAVKTNQIGRPSSSAAFNREVGILQRIASHPNIINVIDSGKMGDVSYYTMSWVDHSLADYIGRADYIKPQLRRIFQDICSAIAHIHNHGILHLDINPSNILLTEDLIPVVIDFGLSRELGSPSPAFSRIPQGTYRYMPPEVWASHIPSAASDIYSVGMTIFHLLTGSLPFDATSIPNIMEAHKHITHPMLPLNSQWASLNYWFSKSITRNPVDRFFNVKESAKELDHALGTLFG